MAKEWKLNGVNQITQGETIFEEGQDVRYIGLVVKGRVQIRGNGVRFSAASGSFIGISDVLNGKYRNTFIAETNTAIYMFPSKGSLEDIVSIIQINGDYAPLIVNYLERFVRSMAEIYECLQGEADSLYQFLKEIYNTYKTLGTAAGADVSTIKVLEGMEEFQTALPAVDARKIAYYLACLEIGNDIQKGYYSHPVIAIYHVQDQVGLIDQMLAHIQEFSTYIFDLTAGLVRDKNSLFSATAKLATTVRNIGEDNSNLMSIMDDLVDKINEIEILMVEKAGRADFSIDRENMEEIYFSLLSSGKSSAGDSVSFEGDTMFLAEEMADVCLLDNSLEQIVSYCEFDDEKSERLNELLVQYAGEKDKNATGDSMRTLRREISKLYYELYKAVFKKYISNTLDFPLVIQLFMDYGLLDERLLTEEHKEELLGLGEMKPGGKPCAVYNMRQWFTMIAKGEKEPSKSEFDMDYDETLRDMRKSARITEQEQKQMQKDLGKKLEYEMDNVFRYNHRLMSSQPTTFVPFLCSEMIGASLTKNFCSADKINAAIRKVVAIDYSLFYRESLYVNEAKGIKKEFIMEEVYPDVLVFPMYGDKGVMWQEISGRKRNSPGRFLLPAFCEGELRDTLIKLSGRFRWELCRTMQGSAWNNIQYKSLTSEYSDYVQFYRKNRDLSDDKKERLKMQIQKARNNTREVFVIDYEGWVKKESQGGIILNKPVRELLATYCPFAKNIREEIQAQPMFRDAMQRYLREKGKKVKELSLRYRVLEKEGVELPRELEITRRFYGEL